MPLFEPVLRSTRRSAALADPETFAAAWQSVAWFSRTGRPTPWDSRVVRLSSWDDWPGPEDAGVSSLLDAMNETVNSWGPDAAAIIEGHRLPAEALISPGVPEYDPDEDPWFGPTAAVWEAAWVVGAISAALQLGFAVDDSLQEHWAWFAEGLWLAGLTDEARPRLLVY